MDCNSYSYMNMNSNIRIIAESGNIVLTDELDFFGDWVFIVSDRLGECFGEFPYTSIKPQTRWKAYEQAARCYNELVPDAECIPLF